MKVLPYEGSQMSLCQAVSGPLTLTLLSPEGRRLHTPIMCKDYLQDALWSEHMKENVSIYGFTWTPGKIDPDLNEYLLAADTKTREQHESVSESINLIRAWESRLGWTNSEIVPGGETTWVFRTHRKWWQAPIRISTLALLIRVGTHRPPKNIDGLEYMKAVGSGKVPLLYAIDGPVVQAAMKRIENIWNDKKFPKQKWDEFTNTYDPTKVGIHGSSGLRDYKRYG